MTPTVPAEALSERIHAAFFASEGASNDHIAVLARSTTSAAHQEVARFFDVVCVQPSDLLFVGWWSGSDSVVDVAEQLDASPIAEVRFSNSSTDLEWHVWQATREQVESIGQRQHILPGLIFPVQAPTWLLHSPPSTNVSYLYLEAGTGGQHEHL